MELSIGDVLSDDNINTAMESLMEKEIVVALMG